MAMGTRKVEERADKVPQNTKSEPSGRCVHQGGSTRGDDDISKGVTTGKKGRAAISFASDSKESMKMNSFTER